MFFGFVGLFALFVVAVLVVFFLFCGGWDGFRFAGEVFGDVLGVVELLDGILFV